MDFSDLMLGNFIFYFDSSLEKYEVIEVDIITFSYPNILKKEVILKGIPIDEDWLLRFGFTMGSHNCIDFVLNCTPPNYKSNYNLTYRLNNIFDKNSIYWQICDESIPKHVFLCKYVHELQNLYKSLTGKKLERCN